MKIAWAKEYKLDLPEGHRFPMLKYELLPQQLLYEGVIQPEDLFMPVSLSDKIILLTHSRDYWNKLKHGNLTKTEIRKIGFPYSKSLIERESIIADGTLTSALHSLKDGIALIQLVARTTLSWIEGRASVS